MRYTILRTYFPTPQPPAPLSPPTPVRSTIVFKKDVTTLNFMIRLYEGLFTTPNVYVVVFSF